MATVKINDPNIYATAANLTDRVPADQGDNSDKTISVQQILALSLFHSGNTQIGGEQPTDPKILYWFEEAVIAAPPVVTSFVLPATSDSLTAIIAAFTVTDTMAITGYMVTESSTPPAVNDANWLTAIPALVTAGTAGARTFYPWARNAAGIVSAPYAPQTMTITLPNRTYTEVFSENFDALSSLPGTISFNGSGNYALATALPNKGAGKVVTAYWSAGGPVVNRAIASVVKGYAEWGIAFSAYIRILDLALQGNTGGLPVLFRIGRTGGSSLNLPAQLSMSANSGANSINLNRADASPANDFVDQYMRVRLEWDLSTPSAPVYTMKYTDAVNSWLTLTPASTPPYLTNIANITIAQMYLYGSGGTVHLDYIKTGTWA